jgi:hypothetical protein
MKSKLFYKEALQMNSKSGGSGGSSGGGGGENDGGSGK